MSRLPAAVAAPVGHLHRESLRCGLFLIYQEELGSLALRLRIPPVEFARTATGSLQIQSVLGQRTYQVADLHTARLVRLAPQFPLAICTGFGDLLPLAAHLSGQVSAFAADRNLFYAEEKGGRYAFSDEPLECGTRYRLLARDIATPPTELGVALDWKPGQKFGEWHSYEMALPLAFAASKPLLAQIKQFFGRGIRGERPRLFVVQPSPHHIELDGTYVYPESPETILLRRSTNGKITVHTSVGSAVTEVSEVTDEWVELKGLPADGQDCTVSINGSEQVVFRVEPCGLFRPAGLVAISGDAEWELFADAPVAPAQLLCNEVKVECGGVRIAAHILRLNDGWRQEGSHLLSAGGAAKELNAGNFGELLPAVVVSPEMEDRQTQANLSKTTPPVALRLWVEGLVAKSFGRDGLERVRCYFSDPCRANLYRLGLIMTSSLMPYIRAAQDQERGRKG
ncbi:hypothetical protein D8B34_02080 [Verminephrobacter eiseniae]|nr:hypothetical protein [Verminephrobacter eiseniae]MCW8184016.1 hypothetical protein [Verminephrobacter eiseniae]MCW8221590.1 hypothetical protein [Verminephrobacter eiseniae]MCW8232629.1 hypothetical protein [Verminephrobacter eiseniae]